LIEARKLIEGELVGLAAERATSEELKDIGESLDRMEQALAKPEEFLRADIDFHLAIAKAGHNRILLNALLLIRNLMREWIRSTIPLKGVANIALEQHKVSSSLSPRRIKPKGNQHDVLPLERYGPLSPGRAADCWRRNFVGRIRHEHRHLTPRISPAQSDLPTPGNNSRIAVWI